MASGLSMVAGNGLGTLYAFQKADKKAKAEGKKSIVQMMEEGSSVALYHTAGKGTRMAPIPAAENNNKPGVKLPSLVSIGQNEELLTILEAVVIQTSIYAERSKGRLAVYWGDQVFVPTAQYNTPATHHADILAQLGAMPNEEEWKEHGLDKYGLIATNQEGDAAQVEKVDYATAQEILKGLSPTKVGVSLGSFSVSAALLNALMEEYSTELQAKKGKFDTDPHWWMPLTLGNEAYVDLMVKKGTPKEEAETHHARMAAFKSSFEGAGGLAGGKKLFGAVGVGPSTGEASPYWWDYGQLKYYQKYNLLATENSREAAALRTFLKITKRIDEKSAAAAGPPKGACCIDGNSIVLDSKLRKGKVEGSVVARCKIGDIQVENSVLVNVTAKKVTGKNLVLYNVCDDSEEGLILADGEVRADCFLECASEGTKKKIVLNSNIETDGGKAWKERLPNNDHSFEEANKANSTANVLASDQFRSQEHLRVSMDHGMDD